MIIESLMISLRKHKTQTCATVDKMGLQFNPFAEILKQFLFKLFIMLLGRFGELNRRIQCLLNSLFLRESSLFFLTFSFFSRLFFWFHYTVSATFTTVDVDSWDGHFHSVYFTRRRHHRSDKLVQTKTTKRTIIYDDCIEGFSLFLLLKPSAKITVNLSNCPCSLESSAVRWSRFESSCPTK